MVETISTVLSNVPVNRAAVDTQSTTRSLTANPEKTQEVARTPYVSPYISIDRQSNRAILQIRDSDTGDVVRQFPTEGQLKAYRSAQEFSERQKAQADSQLRQANTGNSTPSPSVESSVSSDIAVPSAGEVSAPQVTSIETEA